MNERKAARIAAAKAASYEKRLRETNDLSIAFLRARSAKLIFQDEFAAHQREAATGNHQLPVPLASFEPNRTTRAAAMVFFYYASLNVVVEGWLKKEQAPPRLKDPDVDRLLKSDLVPILADFRNAILHPNSAVDNRVLRFHATHRELMLWAEDLSSAFTQFFKGWRESVGFPPQAP